jgi:hypothetical protein
MTYTPVPTVTQDIEYFTQLGIIGGSTALKPLLTMPYSIPAADDTFNDGNTTITYTEGMVEMHSSAGTNTGGRLIWNFPATQNKAFVLGYLSGMGGSFGFGVSNTTTAADEVPGYEYVFYNSERSRLYETTGATVTSIATNDQITLKDGAWFPVKGIALYADGPGDVQKVWMKNANTASWQMVFDTTDSAHTSSTWAGMTFHVWGSNDALYQYLVSPIFAFGEAS